MILKCTVQYYCFGSILDTEPAAKKRKGSKGSAKKTKAQKSTTTPTKAAKTGSKREKSASPQKAKSNRKGLIPNPDIKLLEQDPTFCKDSEVPLHSSRHAIRAVLSGNKELLKQLIADVKNVFSVQYERSYSVKYTPLHYAYLKQDKEAIDLLNEVQKNGRKNVTAAPPITNINRKSSGK